MFNLGGGNRHTLTGLNVWWKESFGVRLETVEAQSSARITREAPKFKHQVFVNGTGALTTVTQRAW
jgi:hypothetical protein